MIFGSLGLTAWLAGAAMTGEVVAEAKAEPRVLADTATLADRQVVADKSVHRPSPAHSEIILTRQDWQGRALSLADLLAEQAGIETRRYGGVGSFQTISVRGSTASRVRILLDDVPLNSAGGSPVDLGHLDLEGLERVEVSKGVVPAEDGGNGMGGVVRLYSRSHIGGTGRLGVTLAGGSHGTQHHTLAYRSPDLPGKAGLSVFARAGFIRSDNDFRYLDRNATPYNLTDDAWVARQNGGYEALDAQAVLRGQLAGGRFRLKVAHDRHAGGLPGREGEVTHDAGYFRRHTQYLASYERGDDGAPGDWLWGFEAASDEETPGLHWTRGEPIGWPILGDTIRLFSRSRRDRLALKASSGPPPRPLFARKESMAPHNGAEAPAIGPWQVTLSAAAAREALEPWGMTEGATRFGWRNGRQEFTLAGDASLLLWQGAETETKVTNASTSADRAFAPSWYAVFGAHGSAVSNHAEGAHMPLGGEAKWGDTQAWQPAWRIGLHGAWSPRFEAYANAAGYYQSPSLVDLYGGRFGMLANPNLRPEKGIHLESGLRTRWRQGRGELGVFRNASEDALFYSQVANLVKPLNLGKAIAEGLEFAGEQALGSRLQGFVTATWQDTRNLSDTYERGKRLPNQPAFSQHSRLRLLLPFGLACDYRWSWASRLYRDAANLETIPSQSLHHAEAHWQGRRVGVHVAAQNLGDAFYEDAYGSYPYPGRQYLITVTGEL